jgi:hypothetical protein
VDEQVAFVAVLASLRATPQWLSRSRAIEWQQSVSILASGRSRISSPISRILDNSAVPLPYSRQ